MDYWTAIWQSFVLGAVQGLTEFLPVSSSGHLTLLQKILGYDIGGGSMMFVNVMLHLGTLLAVIFVFRKDILALFKKPFKTLLMLIVATIPAGVIGLLFNDKIDALFQGENALFVLAIFFSVTAALLLICARRIRASSVGKTPYPWDSCRRSRSSPAFRAAVRRLSRAR